MLVVRVAVIRVTFPPRVVREMNENGVERQIERYGVGKRVDVVAPHAKGDKASTPSYRFL